MNELLDKQTLAAVIAASPEIPGIRESAADLLELLKKQSMPKAPYYTAIVQDLADLLTASCSELVKPRAVGMLLREMGLMSTRTRDGYCYAWTDKQLEILSASLLGGEA